MTEMEVLTFEAKLYPTEEAIDLGISLFHVLKNKIRLKILILLTVRKCTVKELENEIAESQSAVSHQLAILKEMKFVCSEKIGRNQLYSINAKHIESIIDLAIAHGKENCEK